MIGWRRLSARGHFVHTELIGQAGLDIEALSSPVIAFLRACCTIAPGAETTVDAVFERWCLWCKAEGRDHPGTAQAFGQTSGLARVRLVV